MQYVHGDGFYTRHEAELLVDWIMNSAAESGRM